jgi:hypothetical protein
LPAGLVNAPGGNLETIRIAPQGLSVDEIDSVLDLVGR